MRNQKSFTFGALGFGANVVAGAKPWSGIGVFARQVHLRQLPVLDEVALVAPDLGVAPEGEVLGEADPGILDLELVASSDAGGCRINLNGLKPFGAYVFMAWVS